MIDQIDLLVVHAQLASNLLPEFMHGKQRNVERTGNILGRESILDHPANFDLARGKLGIQFLKTIDERGGYVVKA